MGLNSPWPSFLSGVSAAAPAARPSLAKGHYSTFATPEETLAVTVLPPNNTMQNTPVPFRKQTGISKLASEFQSGARPTHPHTREHLGSVGGRGTPAPSLKSPAKPGHTLRV